MCLCAGKMMIRRCEEGDEEAILQICLKTGDAGDDATNKYRIGSLVGEKYILPYHRLEPNLCLVLIDEDEGEDKGKGKGTGRVVGYAAAALDTTAFEKILEEKYHPIMRNKYPLSLLSPTNTQKLLPNDIEIIRSFHQPSTTPTSLTRRYPSHLHIDILHPYHRRGLGHALIDQLLLLLKQNGSPAVHLGMSTRNNRARLFYDRVGFHLIYSDQTDTVLGMNFLAPPANATTTTKTTKAKL